MGPFLFLLEYVEGEGEERVAGEDGERAKKGGGEEKCEVVGGKEGDGIMEMVDGEARGGLETGRGVRGESGEEIGELAELKARDAKEELTVSSPEERDEEREEQEEEVESGRGNGATIS